ncbi:MAG: efflux RND transporter periplasmic adaptor subunit [Candidatus Eisenbacteria bacterium]|nr:efflux RND transporter periplasmic adaptor subunit [Candidatus Latescibacterota bacterium]MBD3303348.1 efflux RND transporter periplasmic adaptor subunit [Candidatus Eisenbacteria bacterium]
MSTKNISLRPLLFPAAFAALLAVAGCGGADHAEGHAEAVSVRTETLEASRAPKTVEGIGTIRNVREAQLASKVMGTVREILKKAGDPVREGEILLRIDSRDVAGQVSQAQGALAQARAAASLAETNLRRFERLRERGSASEIELDQARYQYETAAGAVEQAEGALQQARSYLSYAEIAAPFDGRVVDRIADVGDLAAPGHPLMKIEGTGTLRLHAAFDADHAGEIEVGEAVEVAVPAVGNRRFAGTVAEIVPSIDPATHSFLVKIDLEEDASLRSGQYGRAVVEIGSREALLLPVDALRTRGGLTGLFVAEDGRATFRLVTASAPENGTVRILSGLSAGDEIILDPPATLEVGNPIEVTR